MFNKFVNFELFFTKLLGIDLYKKRNQIPVGHAQQHVFMACSKLEAMVIYLVKQGKICKQRHRSALKTTLVQRFNSFSIYNLIQY